MDYRGECLGELSWSCRKTEGERLELVRRVSNLEPEVLPDDRMNRYVVVSVLEIYFYNPFVLLQ